MSLFKSIHWSFLHIIQSFSASIFPVCFSAIQYRFPILCYTHQIKQTSNKVILQNLLWATLHTAVNKQPKKQMCISNHFVPLLLLLMTPSVYEQKTYKFLSLVLILVDCSSAELKRQWYFSFYSNALQVCFAKCYGKMNCTVAQVSRGKVVYKIYIIPL